MCANGKFQELLECTYGFHVLLGRKSGVMRPVNLYSPLQSIVKIDSQEKHYSVKHMFSLQHQADAPAYLFLRAPSVEAKNSLLAWLHILRKRSLVLSCKTQIGIDYA